MPVSLYLISPPDAETLAFSALLRRILAGTSVDALLLRRGARSEDDYVAFVREIAFIGQEAGCAVLIEGEPSLAVALGVDGLHVEGSASAVRAAMAALKPDLIVGAGGVTSRDDAMTKGELGPDYIMFGPLSGATDPDTRELAKWWAEAMVIPSVLSDPEATVETADAAGCEFMGLGESFWRAPDPAATLTAIAAKLESAS